MANATPSRIGQINLAGASDALFLKVFGGEVLTAFNEDNAFLGRHMTRTIPHGKTAQFPALGKATASYHTVGTEITGQTIAGAERTISIDDVLIADVFIPSIDEAMNHYDYRAEYSKQCGEALRRAFSKNVGQVSALAARASATVTGGNGGTRLLDADFLTNMDSVVATAFDAATAFDEKDVPESERYLYLLPQTYNRLVSSGNKALDVDVNPGGNGSVASGKIYRLAGLQIVKTNHLPTTLVASGPAAYQGDFSTTAAIACQMGAVGTVKLLDLSMEMGYDIRRQGTLVLAKYAVGHGILRPECAVEVHTA